MEIKYFASDCLKHSQLTPNKMLIIQLEKIWFCSIRTWKK